MTEPATKPTKPVWQRLLFGAFVLVLVFVGVLFAYTAWEMSPRGWATHRLVESQRIGAGVVGRIEAFKEANGRWPVGLEELPGVVPLPTAGLRRWSYRVVEGGFVLEVLGAPDGYLSLFFDSRVGKWDTKGMKTGGRE